jgi:LysM domain-containing protein
MRTATGSRPTVSQRATVMQKPGLRLTMRGRIVAAITAMLLVSVTSAWIGAGVAEAISHPLPGGRSDETRVTVRPGEGLWSVAEASDPGADPRVITQEIIALNKLSGFVIYPGEQLWVPRA